MSTEPAPEPIPKLPRGRGIKLSGPELFRVALTVIALVGVIVLTRPCANAVSGFVTSFDQGSDGEQAMPHPGNVDVPEEPSYERLRPGMSEAEIKAAIERSKARAAGSGSAAPTPPASGTGSDSSAPTPPAGDPGRGSGAHTVPPAPAVKP